MAVVMRLLSDKGYLLPVILLFCPLVMKAEKQDRWIMTPDGAIEWHVGENPGDIPHYDHIEMSGKRVSTVLRYGVNAAGGFEIEKSMIWPMLRTVPNDTHASLMRRFMWDPVDFMTVNGYSLKGEKVEKIRLDGMLTVTSSVRCGWIDMDVIRQYLPSAEAPALIESFSLVNLGTYDVRVEVPDTRTVVRTPENTGVDGSYEIEMGLTGGGCHIIAPGDTLRIGGYIMAGVAGESRSVPDADEEIASRRAFISFLNGNLCLETPDPVIDRMFAFAKIRACESIYQTKGGPMHGPGGESYYAAIWANDQAEYVNPFFPFTGYEYANESAVNSFRHFARFMNPDWNPIPSSIIAEGTDIWNGAGDRGDGAMIAYGAARFALASGDRSVAEELWTLIEWCLEYCRRHLNKEGVVASDTDELENRFPSGDANLCTSSLYYDALISASFIGRELGLDKGKDYEKQAGILRENIERYFGANVEGYETYRYYDGNEILRSWICIPLTVGIYDRKDGTADALFSPRLWTGNGLLTEAGSETFWDRSTLYALRGVYAAGETERATSHFHEYSEERLLGEHVPYAIEAWPEGNQRHLSAESGLYARVVTEGIFGIRPTGLKSFVMTPRLPEGWNSMSLRNIRAFGSDFDIEVSRVSGTKLSVRIIEKSKESNHVIKDGESVKVKLGE